MDVEETVSASKAKYIVLVEPEESELHICGAFMELLAGVRCIKDDHADTGIGVQHYRIECWRGRQFLGTYDHDGKLVEVTRAEE